MIQTEYVISIRYTEDHSKFVEKYTEEHPACIANIITKLLYSAFDGLFINPSTVYRHITEKLEFTIIHTQARLTSRSFKEDSLSKIF